MSGVELSGVKMSGVELSGVEMSWFEMSNHLYIATTPNICRAFKALIKPAA